MRKQAEMVDSLIKRAKELRASKDLRPKKIEKLRAFIADPKNGLLHLGPPALPLPLNARLAVTGLAPDKCSVFKSAMSPLLLYFTCADGGEYAVVLKDGDDMRQDQLVIQLFTLMDRLLRKENLDLKLLPYDVLATGPTQGMSQFIPSKTISAIVSEYGTLLNYLRAHHPDEGSVGTYGVEPRVVDTFVRSCGRLLMRANKNFLLKLCSGVLRRNLHSWGRRPTSRQSAPCA
jgi:phosphatidylinositol 3-kinase